MSAGARDKFIYKGNFLACLWVALRTLSTAEFREDCDLIAKHKLRYALVVASPLFTSEVDIIHASRKHPKFGGEC